ncbi:MAG: MFS transporter, partial [Leifsonia sp.]
MTTNPTREQAPRGLLVDISPLRESPAFALIPMIFAGLYGGMLADAFDRRLILIWGSLIAWGSTIALASLAWMNI